MKMTACASVDENIPREKPKNFVDWESDIAADFVFDDYPDVVGRYYCKNNFSYKYKDNDDKGRVWADSCVLAHSNGVCVVCLSPSHPIVIDPNVSVEKVDFQTGAQKNRLDTKPVGKSKRFAQKIKNENELICRVITSDQTYCIATGVRGSLIEVNEELINNPNLIKQKPLKEGYIAIVMPPRNANRNTKTTGKAKSDDETSHGKNQ